jgi:hypothetical protein
MAFASPPWWKSDTRNSQDTEVVLLVVEMFNVNVSVNSKVLEISSVLSLARACCNEAEILSWAPRQSLGGCVCHPSDISAGALGAPFPAQASAEAYVFTRVCASSLDTCYRCCCCCYWYSVQPSSSSSSSERRHHFHHCNQRSSALSALSSEFPMLCDDDDVYTVAARSM